jgi:hypothetical protein
MRPPSNAHAGPCMSQRQRAALCVGVALVVSCADGSVAPSVVPPPVLSRVTVGVNSTNALSAIVSFTAQYADSARVRVTSATDTDTTPFYSVDRASGGVIAVLALRPSTPYTLVVETIGRGGRSPSDSLSFVTSELPAAIRSLRLSGSGRASAGYTLAVPLLPDTTPRADGFVVAFDEDGAIRWYHRFPGAWPIEAKQQPNGHITVYVGRSFGWQPIAGGYVELTPAGDVVRTYAVADNDYTDPHELLLSFRDTTVVASHLLGYEIQSFDLSAMGGSPTAPLAVHTIERRSASGAVLFRWSAGSAFTVGDWPLPNPHALDLVHPSSLAIDRDSNYVVSFQAMDQVVKIDATTGATMWRLGGRRNQFQILDDPLGGFTGQHNVQVLENGDLLMMDDRFRGVPGPARAVEYSLDTKTMVARMVWQYQPATAVISPIMGSVQRLANGATLVGFGAAGRVDEVEADGSVLRNATLRSDEMAMTIPFYRAVRIRSLYASVPLR